MTSPPGEASRGRGVTPPGAAHSGRRAGRGAQDAQPPGCSTGGEDLREGRRTAGRESRASDIFIIRHCRGSPHTFCTKPAVFRARPCQVDNDAGRAARRYCYGSLELALPSSHNSLPGGSVRRHCQLCMDVLEKQQAWYKTYGATLCRRSLHASSRTTTKTTPHT